MLTFAHAWVIWLAPLPLLVRWLVPARRVEQPAVLVPFAEPLAQATGLSLEAVSMTQILGISTPAIPYQAPPLIVAMSISKVPNAVFLRLCLWLAFAVTVIGVPITYFWWQAIGFV